MSQKNEELNFDQALLQLEQVVRQLEMGNLPLEETLTLYKQGMNLSATCHMKLEQVEKDVAMLVDSASNMSEFNVKEE